MNTMLPEGGANPYLVAQLGGATQEVNMGYMSAGEQQKQHEHNPTTLSFLTHPPPHPLSQESERHSG